jgi:oxygen-independent coproporphyrinogen-3 oxidase
VRWWNVKHPRAYAERLAAGRSPAHARELLDEETVRLERVLLEVRLRSGLPLELVPDESAVAFVVTDGLATVEEGRLVLTRPGRLLADVVVRRLLS